MHRVAVKQFALHSSPRTNVKAKAAIQQNNSILPKGRIYILLSSTNSYGSQKFAVYFLANSTTVFFISAASHTKENLTVRLPIFLTGAGISHPV